MQVVGYNAKLLRDQAGNNMYYTTNSITLAGGDRLDVILDTCLCARRPPIRPRRVRHHAYGTYYLHAQLDHLSNDAENSASD